MHSFYVIFTIIILFICKKKNILNFSYYIVIYYYKKINNFKILFINNLHFLIRTILDFFFEQRIFLTILDLLNRKL